MTPASVLKQKSLAEFPHRSLLIPPSLESMAPSPAHEKDDDELEREDEEEAPSHLPLAPPSEVKGEANISYICSRYYQAPELIFGVTEYTTAIVIWSAVLVELLIGQSLFPGESAVDQLVEIIKVLGTPTREDIRCMNPNYTEFRFPQIKGHPWHKPLHVSFTSDKGGNTIDVHWYTIKTNLHHVWDHSIIETAEEDYYNSDVEDLVDALKHNITMGDWASQVSKWEQCSSNMADQLLPDLVSGVVEPV